jgi:hypothetical protein
MCTVYREEDQECSHGVPEWMWKRLEVSPLNFVSNWRSFRYDFRRLKQLEGEILLILNSSPGCHTLSNAWLKSKNAAVQHCWFSIALLKTSLMRWHCCTVQ